MRIWALLCCLTLGLSGCTNWPNFRGPGFGAEEQDFAKLARRKRGDNEIAPFGVSSKAREIEENLGAR